MKTTEELRKELEQLRREEFDACLDFSHKIKLLEEQLKVAEKGDLLFGDVQVQSKLAYVNDLLSNSGIPLVVARKSEVLGFTVSSTELSGTTTRFFTILVFFKSKSRVSTLLYRYYR